MASIFSQFTNWLYDYNLDSEIPEKDSVLKSHPISISFILNQFLLDPRLCLFFNKYLNNVHINSLPKEDLLKFIKQYIIKSKSKKKFINFFGHKMTPLQVKLTEKYPLLNLTEIHILSKYIENSPNKDIIYHSLGITEPKKKKLTKRILKDLQNQTSKKPVKEYLSRFKIRRVS